MQFITNFLSALFSMFSRKQDYFYGWRGPEPHDDSDRYYVPPKQTLANLPKSVDLRGNDGPIFDQKNIGSCTAQAWLGVFLYVRKKLFGKTWFGSRLMLYYDSREAEGHADQDNGAYVRTGGKILSTIGNADESDWPYDTSKYAQKPPADVYTKAKVNKATEVVRVSQDMSHLKACLAEGQPIVFGYRVYESFRSPVVKKTGVMPMPKAGEKVVGGHAVVAIGYTDGDGAVQYCSFWGRMRHWLRSVTGMRAFMVTPPANHVICRNSWGTGWGDSGYFYMPYEFISQSKYASDFWTIRNTTEG